MALGSESAVLRGQPAECKVFRPSMRRAGARAPVTGPISLKPGAQGLEFVGDGMD